MEFINDRIYRISEEARNCYLTHSIKMKPDGFKTLCENVLSDIDDKTFDGLRHCLITRFGFRILTIEETYEL